MCANLVLLARSADDLQRVVTEITPNGSRVVTFPGDVAHEDDIVYAVTQALETFCHIDIVVNAAGIDVPGPIVQLATSDWDYVLDVNFRAPFRLVKAVYPYMSQAMRGTIIMISSRRMGIKIVNVKVMQFHALKRAAPSCWGRFQ
jgi:NADP-dependent 3-hydroxy acid dehydrogenase YdfG